jgi:hypothetical protein
MRKWLRSRPGLALADVAIAIAVLAVLLAAVTAALGAIENGRVNSAERSVETLREAAIHYLSNGRNSYANISFWYLQNENLLPPGFTSWASNPWGGNYTIDATGSGSQQVTITLTSVPAGAGDVLTRKFSPRAASASYSEADGIFSVTF